MRWKADPRPKVGDTKTINRFAWFPTLIVDEYVWLETYCCVLKYETVVHFDYDAQHPYGVDEWVVVERRTLDYYY